uniref:Uncharacterized protein n=1 Tax=Romanomermis culicivorax TaxID=13658 RepID=A0A915JH08_ROMCU
MKQVWFINETTYHVITIAEVKISGFSRGVFLKLEAEGIVAYVTIAANLSIQFVVYCVFGDYIEVRFAHNVVECFERTTYPCEETFNF